VKGHAISDAWLAVDLPRDPAQEVVDRVWGAIADSLQWREWFETHLRPFLAAWILRGGR